jgi:endonuclease G
MAAFHLLRPAALGLALWLSLLPALAGESCPRHFPAGQPPAAPPKARLLCFEQFAVLHSGEARGPYVAAEHLEAARLAATPPKRTNRFHPELRLPIAERAWSKDYAGGLWDRGHMAADRNMTTRLAGYEADSYANVVPQHPGMNRGAWAQIEQLVRRVAARRGKLYVLTGPVYKDAQRSGRVRVPYGVFKVIYDPARDAVVSLYAPNRHLGPVKTVALDEIQSQTGLRFFRHKPTELTAADLTALYTR